MPVFAVDLRTFGIQSKHLTSPQAILLTDERQWSGIPAPVRDAADVVWLGTQSMTPRSGECGWMLWRQGDAWREGSAVDVRLELGVPNRRYFVPVHYSWSGTAAMEAPGFPAMVMPELELVGLEPRWFSALAPGALAREDSIDPAVRLTGRTDPCAHRPETSEPWQQLSAAIRHEAREPGAGIAQLAELARQQGWHRILRALCLRNLIVALLHAGQWDSAGELLAQTRVLFPDYRELAYLGAVRELALGRGAEAVTELRRATEAAPEGAEVFVGSGGEAGYRAHYLLAALAEQTGRQSVASRHFLTGTQRAPAFPLSVAGLLRQRLAPDLFAAARWALLALGRREPRYQTAIFDFLLLHRAWEAAEGALRTWPLNPEALADMEHRWQLLAPLRQPTPRPANAAAGVVLSGPLQAHASFASINRRLAASLESDPRFELTLDPTLAAEEPLAAFTTSGDWAAGLRRLPHRLDLTLRHSWPPDFTAPPTGKLAMILPWEFGAVPCEWPKAIGRVDRVFVPSAFVHKVLTRAGADASRIEVIANGVDCGRYCPQGEAWRPKGARSTEFLFVGGAIRRKGMDVLLRAWREAFTASDDVTLVIKALGGKSFYQHLSLRADIAALQLDPEAAPVVHLEEDWSETRMPALYRGCDVLVLPYRGEGFGLPLAEALACGKPVITTGAGPAPEFCPPEASWLLAAEETPVPPELRPPDKMTGEMTWFEPSLDALVAALRESAHLAASGALARRGALGLESIRRRCDWRAVSARYCEELAKLIGD